MTSMYSRNPSSIRYVSSLVGMLLILFLQSGCRKEGPREAKNKVLPAENLSAYGITPQEPESFERGLLAAFNAGSAKSKFPPGNIF
jgi:hypothetical protein